jgi:hypothetical protein
MKISEDNKYISQWRYYEVARYVPALSRVIRDKANGNPMLLSVDEISEYSLKNSDTGIYTSVFAYKSKNISESEKLGPLYFDLDSSDMSIAKEDMLKLYNHLVSYLPSNSVLVYFTGKKGFHIECEPLSLGIGPSKDLPKIYRYIANDLKSKLDLTTLDFSVYDGRRMWRLAGSKHQDTNLYKTLLNPANQKSLIEEDIETIKEYATAKQSLEVSEQSFNYKANEWYRQYTYDMEESEKKKDNPLEYFNKYGSKAFKEVSNTHKSFNRQKLLNSCSAVKRLEAQAESTGFLEHEARLFLCSILTYTEDSIKYLHEILSKCHDYNFEKSSAHINDWIKRRQMGVGGRPYTCERANSVGVGCGSCQLDKKNKWVQVGNRYVETQEKISPSPIRFAYDTINEKEQKNGK